jgi:hypothetical protein
MSQVYLPHTGQYSAENSDTGKQLTCPMTMLINTMDAQCSSGAEQS